MNNLGEKIVIVGVSASGKSTFAKKLGSKLSIPVVYMDALMWKPGWDYIGDEATIEKLEAESEKQKWIIEGYITSKARSFLFDEADTIIYLDYSRWLSAWRYIKRWWKHKEHPRPELEGSPEKFSFKFLYLVWSKGEAATLEKHLQNVKNKIIALHSPEEARALLDSI